MEEDLRDDTECDQRGGNADRQDTDGCCREAHALPELTPAVPEVIERARVDQLTLPHPQGVDRRAEGALQRRWPNRNRMLVQLRRDLRQPLRAPVVALATRHERRGQADDAACPGPGS